MIFELIAASKACIALGIQVQAVLVDLPKAIKERDAIRSQKIWDSLQSQADHDRIIRERHEAMLLAQKKLEWQATHIEPWPGA